MAANLRWALGIMRQTLAGIAPDADVPGRLLQAAEAIAGADAEANQSMARFGLQLLRRHHNTANGPEPPGPLRGACACGPRAHAPRGKRRLSVPLPMRHHAHASLHFIVFEIHTHLHTLFGRSI